MNNSSQRQSQQKKQQEIVSNNYYSTVENNNCRQEIQETDVTINLVDCMQCYVRISRCKVCMKKTENITSMTFYFRLKKKAMVPIQIQK